MIRLKEHRRLVQPITVDLGDAVVDLLYDFNAKAALYDALTDQERESLARQERPALRTVIKMVWAGLQHEPEPPTIREVGSWIDENMMANISTEIGNAMTEQNKETKPGEATGNPTAPSEAGASNSGGSGQSPVSILASRRKSSGR